MGIDGSRSMLATFLDTLLVLRTIRSADDDLTAPFVPHLAVDLAVVPAVVDVLPELLPRVDDHR